MRPDVAGVLVQLFHDIVHIHVVLITEEAVRARAIRHVLHIAGGQQLHALAGTDVLQVATNTAAADVGTLNDQSGHWSSPVPSSSCSLAFCSKVSRPLVAFTFFTLSERSFRR